jgi:transposase
MVTRRIVLGFWTRRKVKAEVRWAIDAGYRVRGMIVLRADEGWRPGEIASALSCSRSHVDRTLKRFERDGLAGLADRREDNGTTKADERYIATVGQILIRRPRDFGYRRTTWSKRLLIELAGRQTGVRVSLTTMGQKRGRTDLSAAR